MDVPRGTATLGASWTQRRMGRASGFVCRPTVPWGSSSHPVVCSAPLPRHVVPTGRRTAVAYRSGLPGLDLPPGHRCRGHRPSARRAAHPFDLGFQWGCIGLVAHRRLRVMGPSTPRGSSPSSPRSLGRLPAASALRPGVDVGTYPAKACRGQVTSARSRRLRRRERNQADSQSWRLRRRAARATASPLGSAP
jgi:hypothetical protein